MAEYKKSKSYLRSRAMARQDLRGYIESLPVKVEIPAFEKLYPWVFAPLIAGLLLQIVLGIWSGAPIWVVYYLLPFIFLTLSTYVVNDIWKSQSIRDSVNELADKIESSVGSIITADDIKLILEENKDYTPKSLRLSILDNMIVSLPWTPMIFALFGLFGGFLLPTLRINLREGAGIELLQMPALFLGALGLVWQMINLSNKRNHDYKKNAMREVELRLRQRGKV